MMVFGPIVVGAYVDVLGFTDQQAGYLYSAEFAGYALGGLVVFALLTLLDWRAIVLIGFLGLILGNLISIWITGYWPLLTTRLLSGTCGGSVTAVTIVAIGMMRHPERVFGLWCAGPLIVGSIGVAVLPRLIISHGISAPFMLIAGASALSVWTYRHFPQKGAAKSTGSAIAGTAKATALGIMAIIGLFIFLSGQAAVWAFAERVGAAAGVPNVDIGNAIALALLAGIGGGLAVTAMGNIFGRVLPLLGVVILSATSMLLLASSPSTVIYTFGVCLLNGCWYYCMPYLNSVIAQHDSSGRLLAAVAIATPASYGAGPALAAWFLVDGGGYAPVFWIGLLALPIGFLVVYPAARVNT